MNKADVLPMINEVIQGIIALASLAAVLFVPNVNPFVYLVLGGSVALFGVKTGVPLTTAVPQQPQMPQQPQQPQQPQLPQLPSLLG